MLEISNISLLINNARTLADVSFTLEDREVLAVFGHEGAGKSTLLKVISGLVKPSEGSVSLDGKDIGQLRPHQRVELGIIHVPEGGRIFPSMTVWENLEIGAYNYNARRKMGLSLTEVVTLFPILGIRKQQKADTLSGGEKQMLAIARGLMANPRILMLDEPTLGLSPIMRQKIFDSIKKLQDHCSVILVEQQIIKALQVSDKAIFMEKGKIVLQGASTEMLSNAELLRSRI